MLYFYFYFARNIWSKNNFPQVLIYYSESESECEYTGSYLALATLHNKTANTWGRRWFEQRDFEFSIYSLRLKMELDNHRDAAYLVQ